VKLSVQLYNTFLLLKLLEYIFSLSARITNDITIHDVIRFWCCIVSTTLLRPPPISLYTTHPVPIIGILLGRVWFRQCCYGNLARVLNGNAADDEQQRTKPVRHPIYTYTLFIIYWHPRLLALIYNIIIQ